MLSQQGVGCPRESRYPGSHIRGKPGQFRSRPGKIPPDRGGEVGQGGPEVAECSTSSLVDESGDVGQNPLDVTVCLSKMGGHSIPSFLKTHTPQRQDSRPHHRGDIADQMAGTSGASPG